MVQAGSSGAARGVARRAGGRAIALGIALVLAGALARVGTAGADWPIYGHDLANTRNAGAAGPSPGQIGAIQQAWAFKSAHGDFTGTPVVAEGTLVAGTNLGSIYALDAVTGKLRWSRDVGQQINGSAAIDPHAPGGPTVFVPVAQVGHPRLLALSLGTGSVRWNRVLTSQPTSDVFGSPTYWHGTVYLGTSGPNNDEATARGSVVALDEGTGRLKWRTYTVPRGHDGGAVWSTPAIDTATGRLFVGTGNAYHSPAADTTDSMMVLSASSGHILGHFQVTAGDVWELDNPTGGPDYDFGASPNLIAGPGGQPLVGEGQKSGTFWALNRATMRPVWRRMAGPGSSAGGGIISSAYDGSRIYGSDAADGQVFALGLDGSMRWNSFDAGPLHFSPVAIGNGVLYSADPGGFLTARDPGTGAILNKIPLNAPTFGGITLVGGAVYVAVGTGPPPQPVPSVDTSQQDGSGSIIAFGDTSRSGAGPGHSNSHSGASTFNGSCQGSGSVTFQPPLTATPQPVVQQVRLSGTCSGTFTDPQGRTHQLSNSPITYSATEQAPEGSCAGGTDTGSGVVVFRYGQIHFTISEVHSGPAVVLKMDGAKGGSAAGQANVAPSENPMTVAQACGSTGLKQAPIDANVRTTPAISG